jgi:hypothetical protein
LLLAEHNGPIEDDTVYYMDDFAVLLGQVVLLSAAASPHVLRSKHPHLSA